MGDTVALLAEYRTWLAASYAARTVEGYEGTIWRFLRATGKPAAEITEADVASYIERYPYRSAARRTYYQGLKTFYDWAARSGHVSSNPVTGIRAPSVAMKEPSALSAKELAAVLTAAARRSSVRAAALSFLYFSGARLDEMLHVTWADIGEQGVLLRKTKTGKERRIPWSDGLRQATGTLRDHFGDHERMLPRSHQTVWSWAKTAGEEAGVAQRVHPHLFRSTAATTMLRGGARVHAVRSVLGHDNIRTTSRYLADDEVDREQAVAVL